MPRTIVAMSVGVIVLLSSVMTGSVEAQEAGVVYEHEIKVARWEDLAYPPVYLSGRVQGLVVVSVVMNDEGTVTSALAISGTQPLIPACLENVKKWKFVPNKQKKAVIVYQFEIDGTCNSNAHSLFRLKRENFVTITACGTPL